MSMLQAQADNLARLAEEVAHNNISTSLDTSKRLSVMVDSIKNNAELNDKYLEAVL